MKVSLITSLVKSFKEVLKFLCLQHVLLAVKIAVAYFIPDVPKWVDVELSRIAYQSKLALQKEVHL